MPKKIQRQTGSVHIVIIIILIIATVGALGFVAWNNFFKSSKSNTNDSNSVSKVQPQKAKSEILTLSDSDMNKYVNYENKFEFLFPKEIFAPNKCEAFNTKNDTYGNKVPSELYYGASDGAVPMTVLENVDEYIIAPTRTVVQLSPKGSNEQGYIYTSCEVQQVTLDLIKDFNKDTYGVKNAAFDQKSFIVKDASNEAKASDVTKVIFNDPKGKAVWTQDPNEEDRLVGVFQYDTTVERVGGFAYKLWYYPVQNKVVFFALGQSLFFQYPDGSNQYYNPVDSFIFTK